VDMDRRVLRIGSAMVICAVVLRLLSGGLFGSVVRALSTPEAASWLLFLSTGRMVRYEPPTPTTTTDPEPTQPSAAPTEAPPLRQPAVFSAADAALVDIKNYCSYELDVAALLTQPLSWDLTQDGPAVLILHSHGSESYANTEGYAASGSYRTLDENYNMVSIGERVAEILESAGIGVVHDRTLHDQPSYNGSYAHARVSLESYLTQYPSIRMILDLHRDAAQDANGNQIGYTVSTDRGEAAKLMLVMGTAAGGQSHPHWQENLALGVKLHAQLEKACPDICRPLQLRTSRFNQDLCAGALLVEVGAAGNTRQEALLAAEILANCLLELSCGAVCP